MSVSNFPSWANENNLTHEEKIKRALEMQKWLESAKESLPLSKKQKSPREKYTKNTKSKNINLKSMIKKQREKREVVLESKKDQAKRDFLLNLNVRVEVEYEAKKAVKRKYIQNSPSIFNKFNIFNNNINLWDSSENLDIL